MEGTGGMGGISLNSAGCGDCWGLLCRKGLGLEVGSGRMHWQPEWASCRRLGQEAEPGAWCVARTPWPVTPPKFQDFRGAKYTQPEVTLVTESSIQVLKIEPSRMSVSLPPSEQNISKGNCLPFITSFCSGACGFQNQPLVPLLIFRVEWTVLSDLMKELEHHRPPDWSQPRHSCTPATPRGPRARSLHAQRAPEQNLGGPGRLLC